ncbi:MAG TPA: hypothetical protein VFX61_15070 [Micromonosporaceae bacterium]|nr:hypothetical protein [Micromonosporaceae bacterium]
MTLGKVKVRRLPLVSPPIPEGGGRIISAMGELTQVINGPEFRFLAYIEFRPEAPMLRGNHYHRNKTEVLYVISGKVLAKYQDIDTGESVEMILESGDLVTISPRCAHAYLPLELSQAVELAANAYDPDDTIKYHLGMTQGNSEEGPVGQKDD